MVQQHIAFADLRRDVQPIALWNDGHCLPFRFDSYQKYIWRETNTSILGRCDHRVSIVHLMGLGTYDDNDFDLKPHL